MEKLIKIQEVNYDRSVSDSGRVYLGRERERLLTHGGITDVIATLHFRLVGACKLQIISQRASHKYLICAIFSNNYLSVCIPACTNACNDYDCYLYW